MFSDNNNIKPIFSNRNSFSCMVNLHFLPGVAPPNGEYTFDLIIFYNSSIHDKEFIIKNYAIRQSVDVVSNMDPVGRLSILYRKFYENHFEFFCVTKNKDVFDKIYFDCAYKNSKIEFDEDYNIFLKFE